MELRHVVARRASQCVEKPCQLYSPRLVPAQPLTATPPRQVPSTVGMVHQYLQISARASATSSAPADLGERPQPSQRTRLEIIPISASKTPLLLHRRHRPLFSRSLLSSSFSPDYLSRILIATCRSLRRPPEQLLLSSNLEYQRAELTSSGQSVPSSQRALAPPSPAIETPSRIMPA